MIDSRGVLQLAARLRGGEKVLMPFRGQTLWPTVEEGDTLVLRSADPTELTPGMIAVGIQGKALTVGRIVDVDVAPRGNRLFTFEGDDRSLRCRIPQWRMLGLAEARIPRLGGPAVSLLPATVLMSRSRWWRRLAADSCAKPNGLSRSSYPQR
jgi:hypothetical protein